VVDKYFSSDGQDARYLNDTYVLLRNSLRLVRVSLLFLSSWSKSTKLTFLAQSVSAVVYIKKHS